MCVCVCACKGEEPRDLLYTHYGASNICYKANRLYPVVLDNLINLITRPFTCSLRIMGGMYTIVCAINFSLEGQPSNITIKSSAIGWLYSSNTGHKVVMLIQAYYY